MLGLILAGEAAFALPFLIARFFRAPVLELFALSNTELGAAQGIYGIVAMLCYFPGGLVADRFPAGKLIAMSLWTTSAGGLYMATFPDYRGAVVLWGFFGVTTILLFWSALIRATRDWGSSHTQGRSFGLLDAGRGLLAAVMASIAVYAFGLAFPDGYAVASLEDKQNALRLVIYGYAVVTAAAGAFAWFAISDAHPDDVTKVDPQPRTESAWARIRFVLSNRAVWLQAIIVICAYVGFKGFDNYSLFAVQGYGMDPADAAGLATVGAWARPFAALGAGLLGDRFNVSRMALVAFILLLVSDLFFGLATPTPGVVWVLFANVLLASAAIFGLRGLYFALFEEAKVPAALTGTAVGFVSVVGYTPDIFVSYAGGIILDHSPGLAGHQHFFLFLAGFAALGVIASSVLMRLLPPRHSARAGGKLPLGERRSQTP
jgi:nitrate/nitrite transporter NarK